MIYARILQRVVVVETHKSSAQYEVGWDRMGWDETRRTKIEPIMECIDHEKTTTFNREHGIIIENVIFLNILSPFVCSRS